jgi:hypothetical protein
MQQCYNPIHSPYPQNHNYNYYNNLYSIPAHPILIYTPPQLMPFPQQVINIQTTNPVSVLQAASARNPTANNQTNSKSVSDKKWVHQIGESESDGNLRVATALKIKKMKKPCTGCGETETPQPRRGPDGPNTLCNACGLKFRKKRVNDASTMAEKDARSVRSRMSIDSLLN